MVQQELQCSNGERYCWRAFQGLTQHESLAKDGDFSTGTNHWFHSVKVKTTGSCEPLCGLYNINCKSKKTQRHLFYIYSGSV